MVLSNGGGGGGLEFKVLLANLSSKVVNILEKAHYNFIGSLKRSHENIVGECYF